MGDQKQEIKLHFPEALQGGVYSNRTLVTHTKEEFIVDFMMVAPPSGAVTARVIMSPGHVKRIIRTLQEDVSKYESKFGEIAEAETPIEFRELAGMTTDLDRHT